MARSKKWLQNATPRSRASLAAGRALETRLAEARRYFGLAARQGDEKGEYVHQLRVWTRRAAAAVELFRDLLPSKPARKLKSELDKIRSCGGPARDADVLLARMLAEPQPPPGWMIATLVQKRIAAQSLLLEGFREHRKSLKQLRHKLLRKLKRKKNSLRFGRFAEKQLGPLVADFFRAAEEDLSSLENLHAFRICGKKLRYAMELLDAAFSPPLRNDLYKQLVKIQNQLGDVNDHAVAARQFESWQCELNDPARIAELQTWRERELQAEAAACKTFFTWWTPNRQRKIVSEFQRRLSAA